MRAALFHSIYCILDNWQRICNNFLSSNGIGNLPEIQYVVVHAAVPGTADSFAPGLRAGPEAPSQLPSGRTPSRKYVHEDKFHYFHHSFLPKRSIDLLDLPMSLLQNLGYQSSIGVSQVVKSNFWYTTRLFFSIIKNDIICLFKEPCIWKEKV